MTPEDRRPGLHPQGASVLTATCECAIRGVSTDLGDRRHSDTPRCIGSCQDQEADCHNHLSSLHSPPLPRSRTSSTFLLLFFSWEKEPEKEWWVVLLLRTGWTDSLAQAGGHCGRPVRVCCIHTASSEGSSAGVGADLGWRWNDASQSLLACQTGSCR